jgi:predicted TIM-barrel fold metal-dependent hydrolase
VGFGSQERGYLVSDRVIDADGHVWETREELARFGQISAATLSGQGLSLRERLKRLRENKETGVHGVGVPTNPLVADDGPFDPHARLKDMDLEGIDVAVNFPSILLGVNDFPSPDDVAAAKAYNSWYAATYRQVDPTRFHFAALLPMHNIEAAVQEADRAIHDLGATAVYFPPYSKERHLDDAVYEPLFTRLQDFGVPLCIHGARNVWEPFGPRTWFRTQQRFYALVHPVMQMAGMADLALGGIMERLPKLKVAFLESGVGWMPYFIERLDEAFTRGPQDGLPLKRKPSESLLSGNCYFSCNPDEEILAFAVQHLGEDQVIYASDYPHFDATFPNSVRMLREQKDISETVKRKILGGNARMLFGL